MNRRSVEVQRPGGLVLTPGSTPPEPATRVCQRGPAIGQVIEPTGENPGPVTVTIGSVSKEDKNSVRRFPSPGTS